MLSNLLNADGFWECLKWAIIVIVWAIMAIGIYRETLTLRRFEALDTASPESLELLRMQHQRNIQIGILLCFLIVIGAADEFHHQPLPAPVIVTTAAPEPTQPPVAALQPAPDIASFEKSVTSAGNAQSPVFGDITEFNEKNSKEQAYIDWLKERYEAWLITYYYLQKCGQTDPKDLGIIENTLAQKLAAVHADPAVQANILLAAKGSYDEMYRNVTCDGEHLGASKASYDDNMKQLKEVNPSPADATVSAQPAK